MSKAYPFHEQVRAARKAQHLTQAALAEKIGCGQSAISYFENGVVSALSEDSIELLAQTLGVQKNPDQGANLEDFTKDSPGSLAYCPNPDCPSAWHESVNGKHVIYPSFFDITSGLNSVHCPDCGVELESGCKNCNTPLVKNSGFCSGCKTELIVSRVKSGDLIDFVGRMQERNARFLSSKNSTRRLPVPRLVVRPQK